MSVALLSHQRPYNAAPSEPPPSIPAASVRVPPRRRRRCCPLAEAAESAPARASAAPAPVGALQRPPGCPAHPNKATHFRKCWNLEGVSQYDSSQSGGGFAATVRLSFQKKAGKATRKVYKLERNLNKEAVDCPGPAWQPKEVVCHTYSSLNRQRREACRPCG
eukprot:365650-Chlamydomonas_euryale.AAC.20